jgi:prevent-host-death family protein
VNWKIAEAKQRFSEVVRRSVDEPQLIYNRDRLVAVVVPPQSFRGYEEWRQERERRTVADAFAELRALCEEEGYELELPERSDRPNPFAEALDERTAD